MSQIATLERSRNVDAQGNAIPAFILDREGRIVIKHLGLVADAIEKEIATQLGR